MASGSPFSVENNMTNPTYLLPGAAGTLVFNIRPPCCRQRMMSELTRRATMGGSTSPASIDLKAYTPDSLGDGNTKSVRGRLIAVPLSQLL